jgi:phosphoribosyl-ATP pyrophosphohydrolase
VAKGTKKSGPPPKPAKTAKVRGGPRAKPRPLDPVRPVAAAPAPRFDATVLDRLAETVASRKGGDPARSHSARLLARGTPKIAQKLGEEAVETVIEATRGNRAATIAESADLLYHLIVLWVDAGIPAHEVWAELERREGISGLAEKAARPRPVPLRTRPMFRTRKLW